MLGSNRRPPPCRDRTALAAEASRRCGKPGRQRDFGVARDACPVRSRHSTRRRPHRSDRPGVGRSRRRRTRSRPSAPPCPRTLARLGPPAGEQPPDPREPLCTLKVVVIGRMALGVAFELRLPRVVVLDGVTAVAEVAHAREHSPDPQRATREEHRRAVRSRRGQSGCRRPSRSAEAGASTFPRLVGASAR